MNDALQATKPVVLKVEFGSGNGAANNPGIQLTLGTGSNGTGTITGILWSVTSAGTAPKASSNATNATNVSWVSASTSHVLVSLFVATTTSYWLSFGIERELDTNGDAVNTGVVAYWQGNTASTGQLSMSRYIPFTGSSTEQVRQMAFAMPGATAYAFDETYAMAVFYPFKHYSNDTAYRQQPLPPTLLYVGSANGEWTSDAVVTMYRYGRQVQYRRCESIPFSTQMSTQGTASHCVFARYD